MLVLNQAIAAGRHRPDPGLGVAVAGRSMASLLYGLSSADAVSLIAASLTLLIVSAIASYLPARRASRIDPAISLREA